MKLPQHQTIGNFSALQEADVYFGFYNSPSSCGINLVKGSIPYFRYASTPVCGISTELQQACGINLVKGLLGGLNCFRIHAKKKYSFN